MNCFISLCFPTFAAATPILPQAATRGVRDIAKLSVGTALTHDWFRVQAVLCTPFMTAAVGVFPWDEECLHSHSHRFTQAPRGVTFSSTC